MRGDRARRVWLVEQLAIEASKYARNEGKAGDFHLARGNIILDIGEAFDLFSVADKEQLHDALFAKDVDTIRRLLKPLPSPATLRKPMYEAPLAT